MSRGALQHLRQNPFGGHSMFIFFFISSDLQQPFTFEKFPPPPPLLHPNWLQPLFSRCRTFIVQMMTRMMTVSRPDFFWWRWSTLLHGSRLLWWIVLTSHSAQKSRNSCPLNGRVVRAHGQLTQGSHGLSPKINYKRSNNVHAVAFCALIVVHTVHTKVLQLSSQSLIGSPGRGTVMYIVMCGNTAFEPDSNNTKDLLETMRTNMRNPFSHDRLY